MMNIRTRSNAVQGIENVKSNMPIRAGLQQRGVTKQEPLKSSTGDNVKLGVSLKAVAKNGVQHDNKCVDFSADIYEYLLQREKQYVLPTDYLSGGQPTNKMRRILVDWLLQVHNRFHLLPETLHLSIRILDQMLSKKLVTKDELQLLGISAMFVAAKYEEVFTPDVYDYEFITENTYSKRQILSMEQRILNNINFDLSRPTTLVFTRWISQALSGKYDADGAERTAEENPIDQSAFFFAHNLSKYFCELSLLDASVSCLAQSRIAMASAYIAFKLIPVGGMENKSLGNVLIEQLKSSETEFAESVKMVAGIALSQLTQTKLTAVTKKYESSQLGNVASLVSADSIARLEEWAA